MSLLRSLEVQLKAKDAQLATLTALVAEKDAQIRLVMEQTFYRPVIAPRKDVDASKPSPADDASALSDVSEQELDESADRKDPKHKSPEQLDIEKQFDEIYAEHAAAHPEITRVSTVDSDNPDDGGDPT